MKRVATDPTSLHKAQKNYAVRKDVSAPSHVSVLILLNMFQYVVEDLGSFGPYRIKIIPALS
jgi:hypothetical protein